MKQTKELSVNEVAEKIFLNKSIKYEPFAKKIDDNCIEFETSWTDIVTHFKPKKGTVIGAYIDEKWMYYTYCGNTSTRVLGTKRELFTCYNHATRNYSTYECYAVSSTIYKSMKFKFYTGK